MRVQVRGEMAMPDGEQENEEGGVCLVWEQCVILITGLLPD